MPNDGVTGTVEILLATYNGERFLAAQLDSLLHQDCADFTILASDDRSTDATAAILDRYAHAHPGRFRILPPPATRMGPSGNFARLLDAARADHVLFCDQDDVWLPDKVSRSLRAVATIAAAHPPATPILVHTDLIVVDAELTVLGPSYFRYVGSNPRRNSLSALLMGNIATGCTIVANRALYELARPVPREAVMFDHWLAQVAAALGRIDCLDQPTVRYRQHGGNAIGAERVGTVRLARRVRRILFDDRTLSVLTSFSVQAEILLERYGDRLSPVQQGQLATMARLWSLPRHRRFVALMRAGLRKSGVAANIGLALLVLRDGAPVRPREATPCA